MKNGIKTYLLFGGLLLLIGILFLLNLFAGQVSIPMDAVWQILLGNEVEKQSWVHIVIESRLPQAITALLVGAALSVSGLMLQTFFSNPLAGPSILGINAGSSLGVAVVMLFFGGTVGGVLSSMRLSGYVAVIAGSFLGAAIVLGLVIILSTRLRNNVMLLIVGIMVGYIASSLISLLNFFSTSEGVFSYTLWGMGDFSAVTLDQLPILTIPILVGLLISLLLIKPLNALLLGEKYAANLGVNVRFLRLTLLFTTGILTATATAFCGPISFIDLAVPHIARLSLKSSNHKMLLPATILIGSAIALFCNLLANLPHTTISLPLNAITPILGAPVIIYVILNQKRIQYFN